MKISRINSCCEGPKKTYAQPLRPSRQAFGDMGRKLDVTTANIKAKETLGNKINLMA